MPSHGTTRNVPARAWTSIRSAAIPGALAMAGGLTLQAVVPVSNGWLPAACAAGLVVVGGILLGVGAVVDSRRQGESADGGPPSRSASILVEQSNAPQQVAHAILISAVILGSVSAGIWLGSALGL